MEKRRAYRVVCWVLFTVLISSCQKNEVDTNRFVKQGRWQMTILQIGTNGNSMLPKWEIDPSDDPLQYGTGTWIHKDGSRAQFKWIFEHYDYTFTFYPVNSAEQDASCKAYLQCSNLAGTYDIITDKNKLFEFESYETDGYPGISVFIQLKPL